MPTYDYVCKACGHRLEIYQPMSEAPKKKCPECGRQKLERQIGTGAAILFKGSGFYQTDYRSSSYAEGAKKDSPTAETKPKDATPPSGTSKEASKAAGDAKPSEAKPAAPASSEKSSKSARKKAR